MRPLSSQFDETNTELKNQTIRIGPFLAGLHLAPSQKDHSQSEFSLLFQLYKKGRTLGLGDKDFSAVHDTIS